MLSISTIIKMVWGVSVVLDKVFLQEVLMQFQLTVWLMVNVHYDSFPESSCLAVDGGHCEAKHHANMPVRLKSNTMCTYISYDGKLFEQLRCI